MAPPPAGAISAHATSQALSVDEGEAGTTSSRPAASSAGLVQIPIQRTNMPNRSEHNHQPFSRTHLYSRKYKKLSSTMEGPNPGPMDPPGGGRISDRILISTPSKQRLSNVRDGQTSTGGLGSRDPGSLKQRSGRKRRIRRTWLPQSDVCSPQEGRQVETNHQFNSSTSSWRNSTSRWKT